MVRQKPPPLPGRGTNTDTGNNKQITENRHRYQSETLFKYVSMCTQASTSLSNKRTGVLLQPANVRPVREDARWIDTATNAGRTVAAEDIMIKRGIRATNERRTVTPNAVIRHGNELLRSNAVITQTDGEMRRKTTCKTSVIGERTAVLFQPAQVRPVRENMRSSVKVVHSNVTTQSKK